MKPYTILVLIFFCGSICMAQLDFTEDRSDNLTRLTEFLPIGIPMTNAIEKMEREGFACHLFRKGDVPLMKGMTSIGHTGEINLIWCEKPLPKDSTKRWLVFLLLDDSDCVINHALTTGNREDKLQNKRLKTTGAPSRDSPASQP